MLASVQDIDFGIMDSRVGAGLRSGYRLRDNGFEGRSSPSIQDIDFGIMDSRVGAEVMAITSVQDIDFRIMDSRVGAGLRSGYRLRGNGFEGRCWPPFRI